MAKFKNTADSPSGIQPGETIIVDCITYERFPIKIPRLVKFSENLEDVVNEFVKPHYQKGDWIAISEKVFSVSQNLVRHISTVHVGKLAKFITLGVQKHKNMTAWSRAEKMQLAVEIVGTPRILLAAAVGAIGKFMGKRGWFWIVAGHRVSEIDGFIPEDMYPYSEYGVLPPPNPQGDCQRIEDATGIPTVTADANYIDVQVLGISKGVGLEKKAVREILIDNPLGQGNKMTPFVIVRRVGGIAQVKAKISSRNKLKRLMPWWVNYIYQKIYYAPRDIPTATAFIFGPTKSATSFFERLKLVFNFYKISYYINCPHTEHELIVIAKRILNLTVPGVIVEAGAFHGGSTAKLSLVAKLCDRELEVFDSFEGMPENSEIHGKSIYGREHHFPKGSHAVSFNEVKSAVSTYGNIGQIHFHKGFFDKTMPDFNKPVAMACINVDLIQSTKDCLKFLYPLVSPDGLIVSQDAHFPWIINLLQDESFWKNEIGIDKPQMENLGSSKFIFIAKKR